MAVPPAPLMALTICLLMEPDRQHHLDHLHGGRVGDPQAVDELALDRQALQHGTDLRAAAVHHHGMHADLLQEHDVAGEDFGQGGIAHGMAAVLDDEGLARVAPHERQGLGDGPGRAQPLLGVADLSVTRGALGHRPSV
jgi:hypothetical protein